MIHAMDHSMGVFLNVVIQLPFFFKKQNIFFRRKSAKIAEICDHNSDHCSNTQLLFSAKFEEKHSQQRE
jgi:hypothetical protein